MDTETLNKANTLQSKIDRIGELLTKYYRKDALHFALAYRSDTMSTRESYLDFPTDNALHMRILEVLDARKDELQAEFDELMPAAPESVLKATTPSS